MTETEMTAPDPDWKRELLDDFRRWLDELPAPSAAVPVSDDQPTGPTVDLHTLLVEMAALRQELRLQNREQARAVRELSQASSASTESETLLRSMSRSLAALDERLRNDTVRQCLVPLFDVRDALERGREAQSGHRRWWRPVAVTSLITGYGMAIERFDRALELQGVSRVPTVGARFDPRTMKAIDAVIDSAGEDGIVVSEARSGFVRGDEVLRTAEVVVRRHHPIANQRDKR